MYTKQALHDLGISANDITDAQRRQLDADGFIIVENYYSKAEARAMAAEFDRLHAAEGEQGGHEVHVEPGAPRVSNIYNKTAAYDVCLACKPLLAAAHYMLGEIKLHGANLRDPLPATCIHPIHQSADYRGIERWTRTRSAPCRRP